MTPLRLFFPSMVVLAVACGGSGTPSPEPAPSTSASSRSSSEVITREELDRSTLGDVDALTIIKQMRPQFLTFRGNVSGSDQTGAGMVRVVVDNGRLSDTGVLTTIRNSEIAEIRYLSATAAAQRFGSISKASPVILVRRR